MSFARELFMLAPGRDPRLVAHPAVRWDETFDTFLWPLAASSSPMDDTHVRRRLSAGIEGFDVICSRPASRWTCSLVRRRLHGTGDRLTMTSA